MIFQESDVFCIQMKGVVPSSQEKKIPKGVLKQKKKWHHGIDLHKSNCLCVVCVVRRRKRERFAQMAQTQVSKQGDIMLFLYNSNLTF
ncbi:hypothetical protein H6P81_006244 [Aristolochia fimbriata]|uniref:Uncharacterized protein n=1 Tax=Aristolochia fimbriata TaxID=158543 RepID=A0AAV7EYY6_ARIFI|nr:hypothetical protein H6P81_006244 [Aristolochia fimbriata]